MINTGKTLVEDTYFDTYITIIIGNILSSKDS